MRCLSFFVLKRAIHTFCYFALLALNKKKQRSAHERTAANILTTYQIFFPRKKKGCLCLTNRSYPYFMSIFLPILTACAIVIATMAKINIVTIIFLPFF